MVVKSVNQGGFEKQKLSGEGTGFSSEQLAQLALEQKIAQEKINAEKESVYGKILEKVAQKESSQVQVASNSDMKSDTINVMAEQDAKDRVQKLVNIALDKGVVYAVEIAKNVNQKKGRYSLIDSTRDTLADDFYDALKEKNLI